MDYNQSYISSKEYFGRYPEKILVEYSHLISKGDPVLDIGAGQGRNTIYLAKQDFNVEAIDTSEVSIQFLENIKTELNLNFTTVLSGFNEFEFNKKYSAILVFGLLQILEWDEINLLKQRTSNCLIDGGIIFVTAFTTLDNSYSTISSNSKNIGRNSYLKPDGEIRTFFEPGGLKNLFSDYKIIHYWEGLGPEHRHGEGPIQRHAMVEAVFKK